jgi:hypothetical protein
MGKFKFKQNFNQKIIVKRPKPQNKENEVKRLNNINRKRLDIINYEINELNAKYPNLINQKFKEKKLTDSEIYHKYSIMRDINDNLSNGSWSSYTDNKLNELTGLSQFNKLKNKLLNLIREKEQIQEILK